MYVTHEDYTELGYNVVPKETFIRYEAKAEAVVRKYTFDRITDESLHPEGTADAEERRIAEMNRRGICELAELFYLQGKSVTGESGAAIKSFSNEGYSETLDTSGHDEVTVQRKTVNIVRTYFTAEQLYRGVS
ncbi:head-tail connector protein [Christensenella intestinihominis]|uniref:hypothetical protein n=1 Tax=Christensenella intestinihominis TaxID=1851429 RepID=UPI00082A7DD8|nr:hypothetical protein [Christensenella intestinihominis]